MLPGSLAGVASSQGLTWVTWASLLVWKSRVAIPTQTVCANALHGVSPRFPTVLVAVSGDALTAEAPKARQRGSFPGPWESTEWNQPFLLSLVQNNQEWGRDSQGAPACSPRWREAEEGQGTGRGQVLCRVALPQSAPGARLRGRLPRTEV